MNNSTSQWASQESRLSRVSVVILICLLLVPSIGRSEIGTADLASLAKRASWILVGKTTARHEINRHWTFLSEVDVLHVYSGQMNGNSFCNIAQTEGCGGGAPTTGTISLIFAVPYDARLDEHSWMIRSSDWPVDALRRVMSRREAYLRQQRNLSRGRSLTFMTAIPVGRNNGMPFVEYFRPHLRMPPEMFAQFSTDQYQMLGMTSLKSVENFLASIGKLGADCPESVWKRFPAGEPFRRSIIAPSNQD